MKQTRLESIHLGQLIWRKIHGCYREFGLVELLRRMICEIVRMFNRSNPRLDISQLTDNLAIGAAPRSTEAMRELELLGVTDIIDLRAERRRSDILSHPRKICVSWVPTYDDWKPKPPEYFGRLCGALGNILFPGTEKKLLLCCGKGEHRAPLAGVLALVTMGYPLQTAVSRVEQLRPVAELLPVYKSSLITYLERKSSDH